MLACLLLLLLALDGVRHSTWWIAIAGVALSIALVIKGVFVILVLAGAALWIVIDPLNARARPRQIAALLIGLVTMATVAFVYDAIYLQVTGERFWQAYWVRQLGPLKIATPLEDATSLAGNALFYLTRLIWLPAPWSLALLFVAWRQRSTLGRWWREADVQIRRGVVFALLFAATSVVVLSPSNRFAERYAFSATYLVAAAGIVAAWYHWPRLKSGLQRLDTQVPALPVVVWTALMLLRLVVGPLLPRL